MASYSSTTRYGAPLSGRYAQGDDFTDAGSQVFVCIKSGSPGMWQNYGPLTLNQTTSVGVGAVNGATVSAVEYGVGGIGGLHTTLLTLTAAPITVTDDPGNGQWGGTAKLYDFPAGHLCVLGAVVDGNLTMGATGTFITTYGSSISLGSITATTGATLVSTEADVLKSFAGAAAVARVAAIKGGPVATQITEAGALWFDGHTSPLDLYLNVVITDDATHTSGTGTFTGTIAVSWINLGDN